MTDERDPALDLPPRPGAASGLLPSFGRALRFSLPGRRLLVLFVVLAIPPLLSLVVAGKPPRVRGEFLSNISLFLYLQFLLPVCGLAFGGGVWLQESGAGTLPYLLTRPVPRWSILLGRYAASTFVACAAVGLSLAMTLVLVGDAEMAEHFPRKVMAAAMLAVPTYIALFTALSMITRAAMVIGFIYAFVVEGFLGFFPGSLREGTILYYTRSLTGLRDQGEDVMQLLVGKQTPPTATTCVIVLLAITAFGLLASAVLVRIREFVPRGANSV